MNWKKTVVAILIAIALIQLWYWGVDDCDRCSFEGQRINQFYDDYKELCLNDIRISGNLTELNLTQVEPIQPMEPLPYKNVTTG